MQGLQATIVGRSECPKPHTQVTGALIITTKLLTHLNLDPSSSAHFQYLCPCSGLPLGGAVARRQPQTTLTFVPSRHIQWLSRSLSRQCSCPSTRASTEGTCRPMSCAGGGCPRETVAQRTPAPTAPAAGRPRREAPALRPLQSVAAANLGRGAQVAVRHDLQLPRRLWSVRILVWQGRRGHGMEPGLHQARRHEHRPGYAKHPAHSARL
jgi:hypothetical protein